MYFNIACQQRRIQFGNHDWNGRIKAHADKIGGGAGQQTGTAPEILWQSGKTGIGCADSRKNPK